MITRGLLYCFLFSVLCMAMASGEEEDSLAWLGYLHLPEKKLVAKKKVQPTIPLKWREWKEEGGGEIDWIPRYDGYVNILGRSLKVLPKGPDPKTLTRRERHQLNP